MRWMSAARGLLVLGQFLVKNFIFYVEESSFPMLKNLHFLC